MITRRTVAAVSLLGLALTGCGAGATSVAGRRGSDAGSPSGSPRASSMPVAVGATGSAGPARSAAGQPAGRPPAARSQVAAGQPGTASQAGTASQPGTSGQPAPAFTGPGAYAFDTTGTVTALGSSRDAAGTSTLTVDAPAGEAQHSVLGDSHGTTTQDVLVRAGGTYLSRLELSNAGFDKTFAPSPAALLLPAPATPGAAWTWTATSTDGRTTVTARNTVLRTEVLTIGGEQVSTSVIRTTLALRGSDLTYDGTQDTWFAPAGRLPVRLHDTGSGNAGGVAFSADTTSTARSTHPS